MKNKYNKVALSVDVDWAHDDVVNYIISILDDYSIRCTIFCTHKINLKSSKEHEIAIHPNFTKEKPDYQAIKELMEIYPNAKGTRSHRLHFHGGLIEIYNEFGLVYDSNYYMPGQLIHPFVMYKGVVELPLYFSDDAPIADSASLPVNNMDLHKDGLIILNYHPIHVFLNSKSYSDYERAKRYLQNPEELLKLRNKDKGTKDDLISVLDYIKQNSIKCSTLKEINDEFRKAK
jgi:hypothetical protein